MEQVIEKERCWNAREMGGGVYVGGTAVCEACNEQLKCNSQGDIPLPKPTGNRLDYDCYYY